MTTLTGTAAVLTAALSQIGVPYQWGGTSPGQDFDCSGLVQWAYEQAGIQLPRTSQAQAQATVQIPQSQAQPGDLVFMAGSDGTASAPGHVGIYLGGGKYLDAPYTGANVRVDQVPAGATFGMVSGVQHNANTASSGVLSQIDTAATATTADFATAATAGLPTNITDIAGLSQIETFFSDITSAQFWTRILTGTLGVVLVIVGIVVFVESTDTGQSATSSLIGSMT